MVSSSCVAISVSFSSNLLSNLWSDILGPKGFWKDAAFYKYAPRGLVFIGSLLQLQNIRQVLIDGRMAAQNHLLTTKLMGLFLLSTDIGGSKRPSTLCLVDFSDLWCVLWFFFLFLSLPSKASFQFPNSFIATMIDQSFIIWRACNLPL